jgi:anti-sigma B factor antagonist
MEINVTESNSVSIINLQGRLDLSSGSTLKEQVKLLFSDDKSNVHLNLAEVEFINSSGLGSLVSIMKETRLLKGRLTLSNLASYVQEIFDITQLSHIFEIYATQEEALNSYQSISVS